MAEGIRWRAMVLGLFLLASVGTGAELLLLEHVEDWKQWIPLVLIGFGLVSGVAAGLRPNRRSLSVLRLVMAGFGAAGVAGLYLHYAGNVAFELEMYPSLGGLELVRAALTGATPALAPGAMICLGALGLIFAYRHPALGGGLAEPEDSPRDTGGTT